MTSGFGFTGGSDPRGFDMNQLGAAMQQFGRMLQNNAEEGPVRWSMVTDVARQAVVAAGDPSVSEASQRAVRDAMELADLWVDEAVTFPSSAAGAQAWSRSEWLVATMPVWQRIIAPIGEQVTGALTTMVPQGQSLEDQLPEQLRGMLPEGMDLTAMLGPLMGMMQQFSSAAFSMQVGQALGALAGEVLSASDIGLPLTDEPTRALIPAAISAFGEGLSVPERDVLLYVALRESAHQRLFDHVTWLRPRIIGAIEDYARFMRVNTASMQDSLAEIDMTNPQALQELLANGVVEPEPTEEQRAALARIETLLALIEGWVDDVVMQATEGRLPSAGALRESIQRRRASGGPSERAFASLVGLELRPRAMREAHTIFAALRSTQGIGARDAVWNHPDLIPTAEDLTDPLGFVQSMSEGNDLEIPE